MTKTGNWREQLHPGPREHQLSSFPGSQAIPSSQETGRRYPGDRPATPLPGKGKQTHPLKNLTEKASVVSLCYRQQTAGSHQTSAESVYVTERNENTEMEKQAGENGLCQEETRPWRAERERASVPESSWRLRARWERHLQQGARAAGWKGHLSNWRGNEGKRGCLQCPISE